MVRGLANLHFGKHAVEMLSSVLLWCSLLALVHSPPVQAEQPSEYRLKVAFLYNFAMYTEWPKQSSQYLDYCIYGDDPFGEHIKHLHQKKVDQQEIVVKYPQNLDALPTCHVVFITRSVINNLDDILKLLNGKPILTIADSPGSCQQGIMLNMAISGGKVIFEANLSAAKQNGLRLSAQLLRFANEVLQ